MADDDLRLTIYPATRPASSSTPPARAACTTGAEQSTVVTEAHDHAFGIETNKPNQST